MKPATYTETVLIVQAWSVGNLKHFITTICMTYHCAMMRIARFKRQYPSEFKRLTKC